MSRLREDRMKFGRFFFRFPNGEAGTDVFDRVSDFIPRSGISPHISPYLPISRALEAEYAFMSPNQHSRGDVLRCIHPYSAALTVFLFVVLTRCSEYAAYYRLHTTVFTLPSSRPHVGGPQEGSAGRRSGRGGHSKI